MRCLKNLLCRAEPAKREQIPDPQARKDLQAKISVAFADVPQPVDDNIVSHKCDECFSVRDAFKGRSWRSIPAGLIEANYDKLPLFTPAAFHHYLPAYLHRSLETENVDDDVLEYTIYGLDPFMGTAPSTHYRTPTDLGNWPRKHFETFSRAQFDVLVEFLELYVEFPHAKKSLEGVVRLKELFWGNSEPNQPAEPAAPI